MNEITSYYGVGELCHVKVERRDYDYHMNQWNPPYPTEYWVSGDFYEGHLAYEDAVKIQNAGLKKYRQQHPDTWSIPDEAYQHYYRGFKSWLHVTGDGKHHLHLHTSCQTKEEALTLAENMLDWEFWNE